MTSFSILMCRLTAVLVLLLMNLAAMQAAPECTLELRFPGIAQFPLVDADEEKPPDTHIAVGHGRNGNGRIVQVTNNGIQLFSKNGNPASRVLSLEQFCGAPENTCFDPKVVYDVGGARFFIVMTQGKQAGKSFLHLAVSTTSAPQDLEHDWTTFTIQQGNTGVWMDYPCPATSRDHFVLTTNLKDDNAIHKGCRVDVFQKQQLIQGTVKHSSFEFPASSMNGTFTVQPVHCMDGTSSTTLLSRCGPGEFRLWKIRDISGKPAISSEVQKWTGGLQVRQGAPQGTASTRIQTSSGRIMNAVSTGKAAWGCQSSDFSGNGTAEVGVFCIRRDQTADTWQVVQGTVPLDEPGAWSYVPAVGISPSGTGCIVYTMSSQQSYPQMRVRGCVETSGSLSFSQPLVVAESAGEYDDIEAHNPEKWGDYAASVPDPEEDGVFWVAHEVCTKRAASPDASDWGTYIARIRVSTRASTGTGK